MATNLRLDNRAAAALRDAAHRTGRSQQDLLREAVDRYLGLAAGRHEQEQEQDRAVALGLVRPPSRFLDVAAHIQLAAGVTTGDLLDRDDDR